MKKRKFKKGTWLLRKWDKRNGGETDLLCYYGKGETADEFENGNYFRIKNGKNVTEPPQGYNDTEYFDERMEIQIRPATKKELKEFAKIIFGI